MASAAYGGLNGSAGGSYGGAGGKFRKKPFRKPQTTPYDRPPTAVRPTQSVNNNGGGWLSKIVNPASKLITAGAHKLFSSVFHKRLLPPPQHSPVVVEDESKEIEHVQPESMMNVVTSDTKIPVDCGGNDSSMPSDRDGVAELEDILKQKTFTRSEIDRLTALLLSRTVEISVGAEEERSEPKPSGLQAVHARCDKMFTFPAHENQFEYAQSAGISTPEVRSKVLPDGIASPAEIAKAYMGSRPTKASPSMLHLQSQLPKGDLHLQNQLLKEDLLISSNSASKSLSPVTSLVQKPVSDIRTSSNGFTTPRFRGRSAIYSMARTPYSRFHPVTTSKGAEANLHAGNGPYLKATENNPSKNQVLKRRSSVLENDIGSVGPIRRIRQKPNLLHPKTLSLPPPGGRQVSHMSRVLSDAAEASSSMEKSSLSVSKVFAENSLPGTSSGYVPSQSIEMAQKIFEQLDKFSPEKNVETSVGISPPKTFGTGSLESLKPLQGSQDNSKFIGSVDSIHARNQQPQRSSYEVSVKKFVTSSTTVGPQEVAEGRKAGSYSSSKINASDCVMSVSVVDRPQKQRAFQMSAHEDCLEMDDDFPSNEVALTNRLTEERQHLNTPTKSVALADNPSRDQSIAVEKRPAMNTTTQLDNNELKSLANGSSTSETTASVHPSLVSLSSPASNMTVMDAISPQLMLKSDEVAPQNGTSSIFPSSSFKFDKLGTPISLATEVNDAEKTDSNRTPVSGNTVMKSGGLHSVGAFSNGSHANSAAPVNGVLNTLAATADASSLVSFTSSSNNQNSASSLVSSPSPSASFKISNGDFQPTLAPPTSTPASSSMAHLPGSVTAPLFTFASGFTSPSTTLPTSASDTTDKSGAKSETMGLGNAASCTPDAKASAYASEGNNSSANTDLTLKNTNREGNKITSTFQSSDTQVPGSSPSFLGKSISSVAAPASTAALSFSGQSPSSGSAPSSTSALVFPGQATSSALAPVSISAGTSTASVSAFVFGSSGSTGSSSGSVFGSFSSNPFSSGSGTASSVLGTSSSGTSSTFGIISQSPKPTPTTTVSSPSPVLSFGLGAAGTTRSPAFGATASGPAFGTTTSGPAFGATTSGPVLGATSSGPVFGATASGPVFGATASGPVFGATASGPVFGATTSGPVFGATTSGPVFGASTSSPAFGAATSSSVFGAATSPTFGATTSSPAFGATTSGSVFGATTSGSVFGATISSSASNSSTFLFGGNSALSASSPAMMNSPFQSQPAFSNATSQPFAFGSTPSTNSDQVTMEDTMAEDSLQPSTPAAPAFGTPLAAPSAGFAFNATPAAASPFQFSTQPSQIAPQSSSFQPSGSLEFNGGTNSFSLGTSDKSQRRIVRVKKGPRRK
ncbi:hypothetical protein vseg_015999 [Gypsophila vaccaria]